MSTSPALTCCNGVSRGNRSKPGTSGCATASSGMQNAIRTIRLISSIALPAPYLQQTKSRMLHRGVASPRPCNSRHPRRCGRWAIVQRNCRHERSFTALRFFGRFAKMAHPSASAQFPQGVGEFPGNIG